MSHPRQRADRGRRLAALAVLAATAATVVGLLTAPDARSAALVIAEPAAGAGVAAPPATVTLTFSGPLDPGRTHLELTGPNGEPVAAGEPDIRGDTVRQAIRLLDEGTVTVSYHAVLRDGGWVTGQHRFTVGAAGSPTRDTVDAGAGESHAHGELGPLTIGVALVITLGGGAVLIAAFRRPRLRKE